MKLQTKINYRFLALLLVVFFVAGSILYFVLGLVVSENFDEILDHRSNIVKQSLLKSPTVALITESPDKSIEIKPSEYFNVAETYSDTLIFDGAENEFVDYRKVTFGVVANAKFYTVTIVLSKLEAEDLVELISYFMLGLFVLVVVVIFNFNRWLTASIWRPFYSTMERLKLFKIGQKHDISFDYTNVREFEELNTSLCEMFQKAQSDFNNLKEFTENASHEIQTPLAIIKSKLESVLQDKSLSSERYQQIQSAYESVSRLSKLNEALLLLSKIENQQFQDAVEVNICDLVQQRLDFIEEIIEFKKIKVTTSFQFPLYVKLNTYLAEILVNNLLGNAVKHNIEGGEIRITTLLNQLVISNTGKVLNIEPEKLFQRFVKHNAGAESTGLGLAIASQICVRSHFEISYNYQNGFHNLVVSFYSSL